MTSKFDELVAKLTEIFQIDKPELDFGIYKIINAKAGMIRDFLNHDLKQKVQQALSDKAGAGRKALEEKIAKIEATLAPLGVAPASSPEWVAAKAELDRLAANDDSESLVYAHLLTFFSRYYDDGDFISKRRYKEGQYVIPYSGEEVKLHWANADQYYTKSGENFTNYDFKLDNGRKVHFKLVAAATAKDNVKDNDCVRAFVAWNPSEAEEDGALIERALPDDDGRAVSMRPPLPDKLLEEKDGELFIYFQYKKFPKGSKKAELQAAAIKAVTDALGKDPTLLATYNLLAHVSKDDKRTILEKQFTRYTAKNTSDYFIHKDLRGFLTREMNSYVTNEMMNIDDISNAATFDAIAPNLRLIQTFRAIATELIGFMAQLEDFQKKLWLKKKFVVQCDWCVTISRLEEEIAALQARKDAADAPRIAEITSLIAEAKANPVQQAEWERLGLPTGEISRRGAETQRGGTRSVVSASQTPDLFATAEGSHGDTEARSEGARNLRGSVTPCENTSPIDARMIDTKFFDERFKSRLLRALPDLDKQCDGVLIHSENFGALRLLQDRYQESVKCIYIDPPYNTGGDGFLYRDAYQHSSWMSMAYDRISQSLKLLFQKGLFFSSIDFVENARLKLLCDLIFGGENFLANIIWEKRFTRSNNAKLFSTLTESVIAYRKSLSVTELKEPRNEKSDSIYSNPDSDPRGVWTSVSYVNPATKEQRPNLSYSLLNPVTGLIVEHPTNAWKYEKSTYDQHVIEKRLYWGANGENKYPRLKKFLSEMDGMVPVDLWKQEVTGTTDAASKLLEDQFGKKVFDFPKPPSLVHRIIGLSLFGETNGIVLDYFAGTGPTAHAVISLNREDGGHRKYILVEMGDHFDTVLKPRIEKVVYSPEWKDGKAVTSTRGISHCFKYLTLESYEDTLNNLKLETPQGAELGIGKNEYMMNYMLDIESRASLLSVNRLRHPFDYTLDLAVDSSGATAPHAVDLVETFNYLVGLTVETEDRHLDKGYVLVSGTLPGGEDAIILWRDCDKVGNAKLREILKKQAINPRAQGFVLYVNGDHDLPNSVKGEDGEEKTIKVASIDAAFLERMFAED